VPEFIQERGEEIFSDQCIPTEISLLEIDAYPEFLTKRRILMAHRLNEFLGVADQSVNK
jgi:hypothetical protein